MVPLNLSRAGLGGIPGKWLASGGSVIANPTWPGLALQRETWEAKRSSPLFRSHQPSSQKTWQLEKSKEAHARVAISWAEVEEVRAVWSC